MPRTKRRAADLIGTLDFETDPFVAGRIPKPFSVCVFFSRDDFAVLWDSDSRLHLITRLVRALRKLPPCTLYAHNGGKFDFHFLIDEAEPQILQVRNGRVISLKIGNVVLKDSFPLMPFPLADFRKTPIDYRIFEKTQRNKPKNRARIIDYLIDDCADLLELVNGFRETVGPRDTIGSAAFYQMRTKFDIEIYNATEQHDDTFRPYYFGGRVEAFEKGVHRGRFKYLDINSAYPFAMMQEHAHGPDYVFSKKLPRRLGMQFVNCIASSKGALPVREEGSLSFPHDTREFFATGWEIDAGLKTRTLVIEKVLGVWTPQNTITFREYVRTFYAMRLAAKKKGDQIKTLAYKYLLNSGYGKFAQNPREFKEYCLAPYGKNVKGFEWETDFGAVSLWSRPSYHGRGFFDVATAASITGFVRAMLWRAICTSRGVLYCDTDSLICRSSGVPLGDALGEWKLEGVVKRAAIAGKKLYGVEWTRPDDAGNRHKIASKGARLTWGEMLAICAGKTIKWANAAPTFTLGNPHFIERDIRST